MEINKIIAEELKVKETQVEAAIGLLDEGDTVPFIARYRKEKTGGLTDADLRTLEERLTYLRNLDEREKTVIESIDVQGKLTPELKEKILKALTLSEVEDLYRPYKPKRKTRASIAKEKGLEPLALYLKAGKKEKDLKTYAESFMNKEKGVLSYEDALAGAKDILAEEISDNADYRAFVKDEIRTYGFMTSKEIKKEEHDTYGHYASFRAPLPRLRPHQILAMNRGEKEGYLKVGLEYKTDFIKRKIAKDYTFNNVYFVEMNEAIDDALKRLILPSVENEIRSELTEKAEDESIEVFKKNLKSLLMVPPLKNKRVLGFDPGFRTGCKYAFVNENGILEKVGISMITANSKASVERSKEELTELLKKNPVDYIALGNGTASRESEEILRDIVEKNHLPEKIFIVNEAGASVYSASKLGEEEFPDLTVEKRSAVSLARRLQDPLNELVKIDPKSIGVGQYQHDMNQKKLGESLYGVVESCVNEVGVDVNTASVSILSYISGISSSLAKNIVAYLKENGRFEDRNELKKVKLMGPKAYEQCAGFLRIYGGDEELDTTAIHPESYKVAKDVMRLAGIDLLKDGESVKSEKLKSFDEASIYRTIRKSANPRSTRFSKKSSVRDGTSARKRKSSN